MLARTLVERQGHGIRRDFEWQHRNLSGVGEAAQKWAAWLPEETGVGNLDGLTLSRWAEVLPASGLAAASGRWCPHCLLDDRASGESPYFRLAWDVAPVKACGRHKVRLVDTRLMLGDVAQWIPPDTNLQLGLLPEVGRVARPTPRTHDWAIRLELERMLKLEEPISVAEAGRTLGVDDRHLYLRVNDLARALGERWKRNLRNRQRANREQTKAAVKAACRQLIESGQGCSLREVRQIVPGEVLDAAEGVFDLIREVREELG